MLKIDHSLIVVPAAAAAILGLVSAAEARGGGGMSSGFHASAMPTFAPPRMAAPATEAHMVPMVPLASHPGQGGSSSGGTTGASSAVTLSPGPPEVVLPSPSSGPSSSLAPAQELSAIAPLAQQLPTQFATGGSTQTNLALSPGGSGSPSESAPSSPGGGGKTLADCMGFWDAGTHMTKQEWRMACQRTLGGING